MQTIKRCFLVAALFLLGCQNPVKQETSQLLNDTFLQIVDTVGYFGGLRAIPPPLSDDSLVNRRYRQRQQWHLKRIPFVIIDSIFAPPKRWIKDLKATERYWRESQSQKMVGFADLLKQLYSTDFEKQEIYLTAFKDVGRYQLVRQYMPSQGDTGTFLSGRVIYSHIAFNENRTKACFVVMVGHQASIIEKLILAEKQGGKWVIVSEIMLAVS